MSEASATTTYVIPEPFERGVRILRQALADADLRITGELNMSQRIQKSLLVVTAPCLILFACPAEGFDEKDRPTACDAAVTPLHIVVSAQDSCTEVHILKVLPRDDGPIDRTNVAALARLQSAISQAIGKIGMRVGLGI